MSDSPTAALRAPLARTTPDTAPFADQGPPIAGELRAQTIASAGGTRRFVVYVPRGHDGHRPLPLLLNLHGSTSYPEEQMVLSQMAQAADRHQMAVLAPEALERVWNVPFEPDRADDVAFIADAIAATAELLPLHPTRRFATGFSGGGRMQALLAAHLPEPLLAIAPVSGLRYPADCPAERRPTVFAFHGALDRVNPYAGGGLDYWQTGVEHAALAWAEHNGVHEQLSVDSPAPQVTRKVYGSGPARVELHRIDDLGHIWAGFPVPLGELFDPPSPAIDATAYILHAFSQLG